MRQNEAAKREVASVDQEVFSVRESLQNTVLQGAQSLDSAESNKGEQIKETTAFQPLYVALSERRVTETIARQSSPTQTSEIDNKQASIGTTLQPLQVALSTEPKVTDSLALNSNTDTAKAPENVGISLEHQIPHAQDTSGITVENTQEVIETMMPEFCAKSFSISILFPNKMVFYNGFFFGLY